MAPIIVNDGLLISAQQFFREGMDDGVCVSHSRESVFNSPVKGYTQTHWNTRGEHLHWLRGEISYICSKTLWKMCHDQGHLSVNSNRCFCALERSALASSFGILCQKSKGWRQVYLNSTIHTLWQFKVLYRKESK